MASIRRIPGRKVWIACFRDETGRRRQLSTGSRDDVEARQIASEFEKAARVHRTSDQTRRVIQRLHNELTGEDVRDTTLRDYLLGYLRSRKPELEPATHSRYKNVADSLLGYLGERADGLISRVVKADISGFRDHIALHLSASSANVHLKVAKIFFRAALADGQIADNPAEHIRGVKIVAGRNAGGERRPFSADQVRDILNRTDGEMHGLVLVGYYTGLRLSDACRLRWDAIDLSAGTLNVVTRKTGARKIIPLAEPLLSWLLNLPGEDNPGAPVFPEMCGRVETTGKAVTISNRFGLVLEEMGLRPPVRDRKKAKGQSVEEKSIKTRRRRTNPYSFHSLRHALTSHLKESGVSEVMAMQLVGHASAEMSRHYTKIDSGQLAKALAKLPDVTCDSKKTGKSKSK